MCDPNALSWLRSSWWEDVNKNWLCWHCDESVSFWLFDLQFLTESASNFTPMVMDYSVTQSSGICFCEVPSVSNFFIHFFHFFYQLLYSIFVYYYYIGQVIKALVFVHQRKIVFFFAICILIFVYNSTLRVHQLLIQWPWNNWPFQ